MKKIVIIGGGGHAKVLISIINKNPEYSIVGYTDKNDCGSILGCKYLGDDSVLEQLIGQNVCNYAAIGVGQTDLKSLRPAIIKKVKTIGYEFPAIISDSSIVDDDVSIGEGTVIFNGAIVNCGTRIGEYSIINTGVIVDHDCNIGDFVHIASGAVLSGGVKIKNYSMIGAGATIIHSKEISEKCMVGAGSVVISDCSETGTYAGIPAKKIK